MRRLCLVADTNQWVAHLMLRSPTAAAVLFSLVTQDGALGMPEVLEEEIKRQAAHQGRKARRDVQGGLDALRRLLGSAPDPTLPSDDVLAAAAGLRLSELDSLLVRVPFDWSQAQEGLRRVLDRVPPNGEKDQQYKDTLIWLGVLELARDFDVVFVTSDKGFYAGRDTSKGLARELLDDLAAGGLNVTTLPDLGAAAEHLRLTEPEIDRRALTAAIDYAASDLVVEAASDAGFDVGPLARSELHVFVTERPDTLAVTFVLVHTLDDRSVAGRTYGEVGEVRPGRVSVDWVEPTGEPGHTGNVFVSAEAHAGERHRAYEERSVIRSVES